MSRKKNVLLYAMLVALLTVIFLVLGWPSVYARRCKTRIYADMNEALASVERANIQLLFAEQANGGVGYGVRASGVIFERENGICYALTACHAVREKSARIVVMTTETPSYDAYRQAQGAAGHVSLQSYYESLPEAKIEYQSEQSDLAIVSFPCAEELDVAELAEERPQKGARIAVVGHPDGIDFFRSFGEITSSGELTFDAGDGRPPNQVWEHNAYESYGSSGGAVFSEQMRLLGINIGGGTDFLGRFRYGVMIPCDRIRTCIAEWRKQETRST